LYNHKDLEFLRPKYLARLLLFWIVIIYGYVDNIWIVSDSLL
jgi:hypothetical protein